MAATAVRYLRSVGAPTTAAASAGPLPRPALRAVGDDERAPLDPAEFRAVLGHFASGVTVITSPGEPGPAGFACQSFASLSLDPPLVAFMVARTSTTWPRIARAGVFCVNILGAGQGELCRGSRSAAATSSPASATRRPRRPVRHGWRGPPPGPTARSRPCTPAATI